MTDENPAETRPYFEKPDDETLRRPNNGALPIYFNGPAEPRPSPTILFIASTSSKAVEDHIANFTKMFGDEVRFGITTDRTWGSGTFPLTVAFADVGFAFSGTFIQTAQSAIAEQFGDAGAGDFESYGEGDPAYKFVDPRTGQAD
jgi:hypothetical protein